MNWVSVTFACHRARHFLQRNEEHKSLQQSELLVNLKEARFSC